MLLGRYLGRRPSSLVFAYGPAGKPRLDRGGALEFSLSHSGDLVVYGVGHSPLGVDLEVVRQVSAADAIVARHFSPAEARAFRALPANAKNEAFLRLWTRREALLKATGAGLAAAPGALDAWQLADCDPAPGYVGAIARLSEGPVTLRGLSHEDGGGLGRGAPPTPLGQAFCPA